MCRTAPAAAAPAMCRTAPAAAAPARVPSQRAAPGRRAAPRPGAPAAKPASATGRSASATGHWGHATGRRGPATSPEAAARPAPATGRPAPATNPEAAAREGVASAHREPATTPAVVPSPAGLEEPGLRTAAEPDMAAPKPAEPDTAARGSAGPDTVSPRPARPEEPEQRTAAGAARPEGRRIPAGRSASPAGRARRPPGRPPSPRFWGRRPRLTCLRSPTILHTRRPAGCGGLDGWSRQRAGRPQAEPRWQSLGGLLRPRRGLVYSRLARGRHGASSARSAAHQPGVLRFVDPLAEACYPNLLSVKG
jgi:translation initiation factor IF-2